MAIDSPAGDGARTWHGDAGARERDAEAALRRLAPTLTGVRRLGVAYSGGVASATLLTLAARALGPDRVVAVFGVSATSSGAQRAAARELAADLGVRLVEITETSDGDPLYLTAGSDRCFHCMQELFARLSTEVVPDEGLDAVAYAEHADDAILLVRADTRAGGRHRVLRPLAAVGWGRDEVERIAASLGLPLPLQGCPSAPESPSAAAASTDSPTPPRALSAMAMLQADRALRLLESLGFTAGSVTPDGVTARVSLPAADLARAVSDGMRERLVESLRTAGFRHVTLDLTDAAVSGSPGAEAALPGLPCGPRLTARPCEGPLPHADLA